MQGTATDAGMIVRATMTDELFDWCDRYPRNGRGKRQSRRAGRKIEKRTWQREVRREVTS